jgi:hypothetical protein
MIGMKSYDHSDYLMNILTCLEIRNFVFMAFYYMGEEKMKGFCWMFCERTAHFI